MIFTLVILSLIFCANATQQTGRIKFWKQDRSFGFITTDRGEDLYFNEESLAYSFVPMKGDHVKFVTLVYGQSKKASYVELVEVKKTGSVKFWNHEKKFGFIRDGLFRDVYFNTDSISAWFTPQTGDVVEFIEDDRGKRAIYVKLSSRCTCEGNGDKCRFCDFEADLNEDYLNEDDFQ